MSENMKYDVYIPKDLDECFSELKRIIKKEDMTKYL